MGAHSIVAQDAAANAVSEWSAGISAAYPESLLEVAPMPVPTMATAAEIAQTVRASLSSPHRHASSGVDGARDGTRSSLAAEVVASAVDLDARGVDEATLNMLALEALAVCRRQVVAEVGDLQRLLCEREELSAGLRQRYAHEALTWEARLQSLERAAAESKTVRAPQT